LWQKTNYGINIISLVTNKLPKGPNMLNTNFTALVNTNTSYIAPIALPRTFSKENIVKSVVAAINHPFTNSFLFFAAKDMLPPPLFYACIGCVSIGAFIRSKEDSVVGSIFSVVDHPFIFTGIAHITLSYVPLSELLSNLVYE
jgi:hypothetical protein